LLSPPKLARPAASVRTIAFTFTPARVAPALRRLSGSERHCFTDNQVVETTFSIPAGPAIELELAPRLESWNRYDDPDQVALREFVAHVRERIERFLAPPSGPLAFRFDVGLADQIDPLWERDLDNYLFPIARELPGQVVSVWGTKGRARCSRVRLERAVPAKPGPEWQRFPVPRSLGSEHAWKSAVHKATVMAAENR
jgi:hypothetical protein